MEAKDLSLNSPVFTPDEAVRYCRLDTIDIKHPKATLNRYRKKGWLCGTQIGKGLFYLKEELDKFLRVLTERNPR